LDENTASAVDGGDGSHGFYRVDRYYVHVDADVQREALAQV
jgi:hypothetical protein